ncbi:MAG: hypothetical protein JO122_01395, partial [Acetobacteraceae bacterium]|nr:hypothetical protein [Acetobacteraceae bacterium]
MLVGVRNTTHSVDVPPVLLDVLPLRPGPFGQTLLDTAHRVGADLLVMAAYAHSPLRETGPGRRDATHAGSRRPAGADAALARRSPCSPTETIPFLIPNSSRDRRYAVPGQMMIWIGATDESGSQANCVMLAPISLKRGTRQLLAILAMLATVVVTACGPLPRLNPPPEEEQSDVTVLGLKDVRTWGDEVTPQLIAEGVNSYRRERAYATATGHPGPLPPAYYLAISGGG